MYQNQNPTQNQNQTQANPMQGANYNNMQQNGGAQQGTQNNNSRSNRAVVPEAKSALNQMKFEIAQELGVPLKQGYNGDLPSRQAGYIGGYMTNLILPGRRFVFDRTDLIGRSIHKMECYAEIQVV